MSKYYHNTLKLIRSKIGLKIGVLVFIQIFFIVISLIILSYYQSQMTYLGNSINIAGKNRFLTSNLMFSTAEYFIENNSDISNIKAAINELESNILTLKHGGKISDIDLKPLPSEFSKDWDSIYQKWILLKTILTNNILKQNQIISPIVTSEATTTSTTTTSLSSEVEIDKILKTILETGALPLINSSNVLVTKLGEYAKNSSQNSLFLYILFAVLNIGITTAFVLYLVRKILKPILALTSATSEVKSGNLNVVIKSKGNGDELSVLTESFNSMVTSIKNYINKQNELKKELEKANEELKYRDQLKDEFINVAAHELKTPIQPILGLCELLRDRETNIEKDEEILDVIIRNSKRLLKLAEDILNVARIESGSFLLKKEKFDLKEMITEILREYEQKIVENKKNIKLSYESDDNNNEIIIEADRNRLSQVVSNLLNNASNFTNEGSITVIVERKNGNNSNNDNEVTLSIKDTGTGIHPEILSKLFTKFATKSTIAGTGLGLFISKKIIQMHGGKIWANNNSNGIGSTFYFTVPIVKTSQIVINDDESDITFTIKNILEDNGFKVDSFTESISALDNYQNNFYDLIILDIKMPKMDGFQLYTKIREQDPKVNGNECAKCCEVAANIAIDVLKMESEGIKAVKQGLGLISEAAKVVRTSSSSAISDSDMMDELEKSC